MAALRSHLVVLTLLGALTWGARAQADDPAPGAPPQAPVPAPGAPPPGVPPAPVAPKPVLAFPNDVLIERADGKVVYFYRTNFVTPGDLEKSIALMNLTGVKFMPFPTQNQLLVEGPPEAVEVALDALAYFDIATPQVFLEAKVVELTSDSNFEYGLDYALDRNVSGSDTFWRGINGFLSPPSLIASTLPGGLPFQGTNLLFGLIPGTGGSNTAMKFGAFEMTLQALQENGKAEILSKPSIICTQGLPAEVITSEQFSENRLDTSLRSTNIAGPADAPVANVTTNENYKALPAETGVTLRVLAQHIGENFVKIEIHPTVKGLAGSGTRLGGTNAQITTTRSAKTVVTLADGETLVIGGLYTNRLVKGEARTPLLSDLPLVGTLFTRQHETKQKTELIFILTPRIIRKNVDARVILPPAELERLEQRAGDGKCDHCGPCTPLNSMEDALFPKGASCRRQQQREAARASAESSSSPRSSGPPFSGPPPSGAPSSGPPPSGPPPSGPPSGPPSASSRPPPPPPPPPEPPAHVRAR